MMTAKTKTTDLDTIGAVAFGHSLSGVALNYVSRDVRGLASFLEGCLGMSIHQLSDDFAIAVYASAMIQLHSDGTYRAHPLLDLVPENPPRGSGFQAFVMGVDPDAACARAEAFGGTVIEQPTDKPHGLREATILSPDGYAFSPAVARP